MKYPKVQKYCLMSVKGSYTDFHIDFGGTSVWYHVLRGRKVFWMVPPTELNLTFYEEWTLSGKQQDVFFGDTVEECFRIELEAGNTFFIPSGWIHAVYTPEDSLVFGGNFLHSYGIEKQLRVSQIEDVTKVPMKFRYPFYTEVLWYVLQHYVFCLTGKDHIVREEEKEISDDDDATEEEEDLPQKEPAVKNKRLRPANKKGSAKKARISNKKKGEEDDDQTEVEDTDIEENEDEETKATATTTCRMTKNSLLRLQYEIVPSNQNHSDKTTRSSPELKPSPQKESKLATSMSTTDINGPAANAEHSRSNGWVLSSPWTTNQLELKEPKKIHLTKYEISGLKVLVKYLSKLTGSKKNLPKFIKDSKALIDDTKKMIVEHENDDPDLAITGKPVSHFSVAPNNTDINQLIGQFFRIKDDQSSTEEEEENGDGGNITDRDRSSRGKAKSTDKKTILSSSLASLSSPSKSTSNKAQQTTMTASNDHPVSRHSSPSKKEKTVPQSSTTPPPRPPSPPTRPLSYNQYSAKTKGRNLNDPLPGSFASLIAATSTERNSFDLSVSDAATVPLSISLATDRTSWARSSTSGSEGSSPGCRKNEPSQPNPNKWGSLMTSKSDSSKKQQTEKSTSSTSVKAPNSPIPPKIPQQKPPTRFASLNQKPQNKEKLIFASTPYNSNAHGPQPRMQPNSIVNRPMMYQPPYATPYHSSLNQFIAQPPISPYHRPPHHLEQRPPNMHRMIHLPIPEPVSPNKPMSQPQSHQSTAQRKPSDLPNQLGSVSAPEKSTKYQYNQVSTTSPQQKESFASKFKVNEPSGPETSPKQSDPVKSSVKSDQTNNDATKSEDKTPIKQNTDGPSSEKETSKQQPKTKVKRAKKKSEKSATKEEKKEEKKDLKSEEKKIEKKDEKGDKAERSTSEKKEKKARKSAKSQKAESSTSEKVNPPVTTSTTSVAVTAATSNTMPVAKNSFIMAHPMMNINDMRYPAQFQTLNNQATMNALARGGFPGFISPFPQQIGIPTMRNLSGARFILAAPQARPNLAPSGNRPIVPGVRMEPDNAALLSLATTALSTNPQTSTYSHMAPRPNVTQAILVGPPNSSNMYAGQHFFRPIIQPMVSTGSVQMRPVDGIAPRPMALQTNLGPLVLARLPNQAAPRFLITSPMLQQAYQLQHRPPLAPHQVPAQGVAVQTATTAGSLTPGNSGNGQDTKSSSSKQGAGNEPTYRQPPKKMARAMFIPTSAWNQLQSQNKTPIAIISNNSMSTSAISTPIMTTNSGLLAQGPKPSTIPMKSHPESTGSMVPSNNDSQSSKNQGSKVSKRPAKARHKRGGHRCQTRRMRCSKCPSCIRSDCGSCDTCKNMSKFGGPGTQKQACLARQCTNPQLPRNVVCEICNIDGFTGPNIDTKNIIQSTLMECNTCYKIVHPQCFKKKRSDLAGVEPLIDTDFVNSWKCPGCVSGKSDSPELLDSSFESEPASKGTDIKDLSSKAGPIGGGGSCQKQTITSSTIQFPAGLPTTSKLSA